MNEQDIRDRVAEIAALNDRGEHDAAREAEHILYRELLLWIANGVEDPAGLAKVATVATLQEAFRADAEKPPADSPHSPEGRR
ncbi:hypothetical protein NE857_33900 (plasmid) [Nocardiopsis exhalans]|uniref:Uncharacterized protein n=1 Tax=Nocardiopsis exhalans TaxID=163604 RepID=A0ABY5DJU7_9ACTN|nr:hypothetical protein [Nocardiopsis exhalans]USY23623.1 hypothetical protein NE857_33900 [Nocardiopsis exhalans]